MPRNGAGAFSAPAGTLAAPNTTIESSKYNALVNDLVADANNARPIVAGGTGATSAAGARTALAVPGLADANVFTGATTYSGTSPSNLFIETDGPVNETQWRVQTNGGNFNIQALNDAGAGAVNALVITRTATTIDQFQFAGTLVPATADGAALGTIALPFSDAFFATGAVLNINNDWIATHTAGILTVGTGDLRITNAGANAASAVTVGGAQTLTNKTLTAPMISQFELGNADTTITRSAAGRMAVEGVDVVLLTVAQTLTNKTLTSPTFASPTISEATVSLVFNETDGPVDEKNFRLIANGGNLNLQGLTDVLGGAVNYLTFARTGTTLDQLTIAGTELQFDGTTLDINAAADFSGQVTFANGTVGAPSIAFGSDLDTGFYSQAANQIGVATNGTLVMTFGTGNIVLGGDGDGGEIDASGGAEVGASISTAGFLVVSRSAATAARFKRSNAGRVLDVFQGTSNVGGATLSGGTTTSWDTSSDQRLKTLIAPLDPMDAIALIRADPALRYEWNELSNNPGSKGLGWFAQQSWALSHELASPGVGEPGDENFQPWGMDLGKRTPYLWAALSNVLDRLDAAGL